jgi:hypothetical protein
VGVLALGALQLPDRPTVLGWFAAGATPGAQAGTAVIAGHLDSAVFGAGALERLSDLRVGDELQVTDAGREPPLLRGVPHVVPEPRPAARGLPPRRASAAGGHHVRRCFRHGTRHYADNVVVLAVPA